ncbi:MAG: Tol-Pal system beta propeller repeat protein TolB [Acidobacteriota bacterium]
MQALSSMLFSRCAPLAALCICISFPALAQETEAPATETPPGAEGDVEIDINREGVAKQRLALPAATRPAGLNAEALTASREIEDTLRNDLELTGIFVIQDAEDLRTLRLTGEREADFAQYQSVGNQLILLTEFKDDGGNLILEGRLYDLQGRALILGKRYSGTYDLARRFAHMLSDEIAFMFTGRKGIALTGIAFTSNRDGNGTKELYLMDYDGYGQRAISAHRTLSFSPAWAPNGAGISYVSYFEGTPSIYWAELATGQKRSVVSDDRLSMSPSFSPDGRSLVFSRSVNGNNEIFSVRRDGSQLKRLTNSRGIDTNPSWSPNGQSIAFTSSRSGSPQIYVMDADGSNPRRVTFGGKYNDGASWSPDGSKLVFARRTDNGRRFDIAVADLVTLEETILTGGPGSHEAPSYSPNGRFIAFESTRAGGTVKQVWVMTAEGRDLRQLTTTGENYGPSWSPYLE